MWLFLAQLFEKDQYMFMHGKKKSGRKKEGRVRQFKNTRGGE